MLLNKIPKYYYLLIAALFLFSCGDKDDPQDKLKRTDFNNPETAVTEAKRVLGDNVEFAYAGNFDADTLKEISAGTEIEDRDVWGIKFHLLKIKGVTAEPEFETGLLEGSFNESLINKIKFPGYEYELLYYSSLDYYLGTGGGEVFSYIIDFNLKQIYYAHLFTEPGQPVSLFLSENIQNDDVKNFFISNFKRDYPAVKVVSKDVDLEY